ncbi:hypothetical protein GAYE_SCF12G3376 [Galdieria yellowstonensis]|uniref:Cas12f1-like TNB domain-containing protein n=1 Tax=Galdieria yellowstonensis TaxID=3028027 RepID=A0AAV9IDK8_9RHOD|nr:hypothetical protein GAYE_SCF12G3376 [Galdieria yellowstonensis]
MYGIYSSLTYLLPHGEHSKEDSPRGAVLQVGEGDVARIYRLAYALDRLHSQWSQQGVKHGKGWRIRKAGATGSAKICHIVGDLYEKLAKFLCTNFCIILPPKFQTFTILRRRKRKFKPKTARALTTWSHYRFQQRLLQKSREYPWCRVIIVNEVYSSKICGICGQINSKRGGRKTFSCPHCKMRCGRDIHGARNILLRFLSE